MKAAEREAWLRSVVTRISGRSAQRTAVDADLHEAVGLDSLGRLEVLAAIEDEFDFFFDDVDLINASTLARMLDATERRLAETTGADA